MTTIAYRNGVMAADTRAYSGGKLPIGTKTKIERLEDGTLLGVSSITPGGGPEAAVEIACQLDVWSDGPVVSLSRNAV